MQVTCNGLVGLFRSTKSHAIKTQEVQSDPLVYEGGLFFVYLCESCGAVSPASKTVSVTVQDKAIDGCSVFALLVSLSRPASIAFGFVHDCMIVSVYVCSNKCASLNVNPFVVSSCIAEY